MKIGYKLVRTQNRVLVSCTQITAAVKYCKKEFTTPKKGSGPLCVFETEQAARAFRDFTFGGDGFLLFRCEYKPSRAHKVWKRKRAKLFTRPLARLPKGTVLATRVRLLEDITYEYSASITERVI